MLDLRQSSTMAAALLVGAALVILWPRPDTVPTLPDPGGQPGESGASEPIAGEPTAPAEPPPAYPSHPTLVEPPSAAPVSDPEMLRSHLETAPKRWLQLAARAEVAADPRTRALAPRLHQLATMAPHAGPNPQLQASAALLLAELALVDDLAACSLGADALVTEIEAISTEWIGPAPVASDAAPR